MEMESPPEPSRGMQLPTNTLPSQTARDFGRASAASLLPFPHKRSICWYVCISTGFVSIIRNINSVKIIFHTLVWKERKPARLFSKFESNENWCTLPSLLIVVCHDRWFCQSFCHQKRKPLWFNQLPVNKDVNHMWKYDLFTLLAVQ